MAGNQYLAIRKRILFRIIVLGFFIIIGILALALTEIVIRSNKIYEYYKTRQGHIEGKIFRYDPELGTAPVPDSVGKMLYPDGSENPIRFDRYGFRVPLDAPERIVLTRPLILMLGCSYSFGHGVPAEKTYCYLVGEKTQSQCLNSAYPAFGLSQMLVLAEKLIPQYQPDLVLVQFSPWLISRAKDPFALSWLWTLTSPYFYSSPEQGFLIQPPVFHPKIYELDLNTYRYTPRGVSDYLSFLVRAGIPLFISGWYDKAIFRLKVFSGDIPAPAKDSGKIAEFAYRRIQQLCAENHSRMMVVIITDPGLAPKPTPEEIAALNSLANAVIVNTEPALLNALPVKTRKAYDSAYRIWSGSPPVCIDEHPNEAAHRIIASEVIKAVQLRE